jgi:hypothetical protein
MLKTWKVFEENQNSAKKIKPAVAAVPEPKAETNEDWGVFGLLETIGLVHPSKNIRKFFLAELRKRQELDTKNQQ